MPKKPFPGKWIALRQETKTMNNNWVVFRHLHPVVWDFTHDKHAHYDGYVERRFFDDRMIRDPFVYNPENDELIIDEEPNSTDDCFFDEPRVRYRAIKRSRSSAYLYVLEFVESEPDGFYERFVIRKYSPFALAVELIRYQFARGRHLAVRSDK